MKFESNDQVGQLFAIYKNMSQLMLYFAEQTLNQINNLIMLNKQMGIFDFRPCPRM